MRRRASFRTLCPFCLFLHFFFFINWIMINVRFNATQNLTTAPLSECDSFLQGWVGGVGCGGGIRLCRISICQISDRLLLTMME